MKTRNILRAIGLTAALGCGNGYGVNNDEPVDNTDNGYHADLNLGENLGPRISIPQDENEWRPTYLQCS